MKKPQRLKFFLLFFLLGTVLFANDERGDAAIALRYAQWAINVIEQGHWSEALLALERATDFANASSDISYLLALARYHQGLGRASVLEALAAAFAVDRWVIHDPEEARLFKIENLIALRFHHDALIELSSVRSSPRQAELTLKALVSHPVEFRRVMAETLDRFPRETGPLRVFFRFLSNIDAGGRHPERADFELLDLIIRRLPLLLPDDPELAWMAASFMWDRDEARRLVSAYRAVNVPLPASLPVAVRLGVIDEETALQEFFGNGLAEASAEAALYGRTLDFALLEEMWALLTHEQTREIFRRNLSIFTGVITEDADRDGIPETFVEYYMGMIVRYTFDPAQGGLPYLDVFFEAGIPAFADVLLPGAHRQRAALQWERFPAVRVVELEGVMYIPRPVEFHYSPFLFRELWGSGTLFPQRDHLSPSLTRRLLVMQSYRIQRPSREFRGGMEVVELAHGIPVRAREFVGDLMVAETQFLRGRPQLQRVDLNFDGRMNTFRWFRQPYRPMELEDLWDYDRDFERIESDWDVVW